MFLIQLNADVAVVESPFSADACKWEAVFGMFAVSCLQTVLAHYSRGCPRRMFQYNKHDFCRIHNLLKDMDGES